MLSFQVKEEQGKITITTEHSETVYKPVYIKKLPFNDVVEIAREKDLLWQNINKHKEE